MKKNLAKKITLSILAGAMLMSSSVAWADDTSFIVNSSFGPGGAIAIGGGSSDPKADGNRAIAIGNAANAAGYQAVAIGQEAYATKAHAVAIGTQAKVDGANSVAIGLQAKATGDSSVAIGDGAIANASNVVSVGNGGASDAGGPGYRKIINVADGEDDHDAATVGQMKDELGKKANAADVYTKIEVDSMMLGGSSDAIAGINQRFDKTNAKINKVGAGAAALAALHPLEYDPDDKLTFSAGMGNYAGENAAALGAFYRPNEKFMVSLGGTMGNGENMVNLGLSIGLDKPNGYAKLSKRELIQKVNAMEAKYEAVEAEKEAMKAEMAEMKAMLQAILAKK